MKKLIPFLFVTSCACNYTFKLSDKVLLEPDDCVTADGGGLAILLEAVYVWNDAGAHFTLDKNASVDNYLPVVCETPQEMGNVDGGTNIVGQDYGNQKIIVNSDFWEAIADYPSNYNNSIGLNLIVHEMGHSLGLVHPLGDSKATMYWTIHPFYGLNETDLADLNCAQHGGSACNLFTPDTKDP